MISEIDGTKLSRPITQCLHDGRGKRLELGDRAVEPFPLEPIRERQEQLRDQSTEIRTARLMGTRQERCDVGPVCLRLVPESLESRDIIHALKLGETGSLQRLHCAVSFLNIVNRRLKIGNRTEVPVGRFEPGLEIQQFLERRVRVAGSRDDRRCSRLDAAVGSVCRRELCHGDLQGGNPVQQERPDQRILRLEDCIEIAGDRCQFEVVEHQGDLVIDPVDDRGNRIFGRVLQGLRDRGDCREHGDVAVPHGPSNVPSSVQGTRSRG